jgi:hypothetical protein
MQEPMPNAAQRAVRLFANCSSVSRPITRRVPHICPNLADVGRAEGPSRFSRTAFPAIAHRSRKYSRIKCVDDFHFRSKYIAAARSRGTPYAFENKIESRKLSQNQMHGPRSKKRGPMESNTCTPSGVDGGREVGGPLTVLLYESPAVPALTARYSVPDPLRERPTSQPCLDGGHASPHPAASNWLCPIFHDWLWPPVAQSSQTTNQLFEECEP